MNLDLEQSAPLRRRGQSRPESNDRVPMIPTPPPGLPARHPLQLIKRSAIIGVTLYAMHGEFVPFQIHSPPLQKHTLII